MVNGRLGRRVFPIVRAHWPLVIGALLLMASSPVKADDAASWKLQPLAYNHPGLVVDLGVGLWAWPMPMDYDRDGDMDLLVACPDKPSNGVYFFENPSQDPSVRLPVFRSPVRIGDAHHNMMCSFINGEPVILRPGLEYRMDAKTGTFSLDSPQPIQVPSKLGRTGRIRGNMWRYADLDGDGDQDLVIGMGDWTEYGWDHAYDANGEWRNGRLRGTIHWVVNEGNDRKPSYAIHPQQLLTQHGEPLEVFGWPCPNLVDFDQDGDLDLLCGEFLDGFTYFQNLGTAQKPIFAAGERLQDDQFRDLKMELQMITPTAVDWDQDGDVDLIVGDEDGRVAWVENTGRMRNQSPVFRAPVYFQQQADTLKFGALATPYAFDWDQDGDQDILCGNTAGQIGWFENRGLGKDGRPSWEAPQLLEYQAADGSKGVFRILAGPNGSIQGPCEAKWGYTTLSVTDWDGDGDGDILYNSILGRVGMLLQQSGTLLHKSFDVGIPESPPAWHWQQTHSADTITQWRTTPLAHDFDGDGTLDLVMLDQQGFLTLRRSAGKAERVFLDEKGQPIRLNEKSCGGSGRVKLAVVDWDQDARLDVLVNSENALWYRNVANRGDAFVMKRIGNLAKRNVAGHTSSPAVCDFDGNGQPDLLIGSENGRIYHIAHEDCLQYDREAISLNSSEPGTDLAQDDGQSLEGKLRSEFVFGKVPFAECHASTICQTTRGLVAAWFGGTKEGHEDVGIWTSYHDGRSWSKPIEVANGVQTKSLRYPCWNPVLHQTPGDGPTLLFYKVGPNPREWWGEWMISFDRGRTFTGRRRLPESIDGPVRCKPILLDDQRTLLCGSSTEFDGWRVHFESVSLLDGKPATTWNRIGPINTAKEFNAIQPTFLRHRDGRLQVLCRTREGVVSTSFSNDEGKHWSTMKATDLPNPNSGIDAVTLTDGRHLLVYNHLGSGDSGWGRRSMLNLALSDDGLSWRSAGVLEKEKKGEFSYPAMIQTNDGLIHLTYTFNRKQIKHVVLDPMKLELGEEIQSSALETEPSP